MITSKKKIRVRYSETDQMGYSYYGNYAQYFEIGRTEWLRDIGISYKELEDNGVMLPVINMNVTYHKPAKYDDLLTIVTSLNKKPLVRIEFDIKIYNEKNDLLTTGYTSLVFVDMKKNTPTKAPQYVLDKIDEVF